MLAIFKKHFYHLYKQPTLIQRQVYQPLADGKDVVGLSPTGSGKTVAFLLPLLAKVVPKAGTQMIIFEPSQELAIQTAHVTREWGSLIHIKTLSLTGGANLRRQKDKLKQHPDVIIGTPGRIQVMAENRKLKMSRLKSVVIDEADDLLHGHTLSVIRNVLNYGPSRIQLSYFSATDIKILHHLKSWFTKDAERIDVRGADQTRGPVTHGLLRISRRKRNKMLKMLMEVPRFKALVFFDSLKTLNRTYSFFRHSHIRRVAKLAGYQGQIPRAKAMKGFRRNRVRLLLTTDMAARGLDIPALPAVINYDLPRRRREYIHRIGRTGRMGHSGLVINFGDRHDFRDLRHLLTGLHYHFETIYFYKDQILNRPQLRQQLAKVKSRMAGIKSKIKEHPQKRHVNSNAFKRKRRPMTKKRRKHRKRKHSKNKGMRHKWAKEDRR